MAVCVCIGACFCAASAAVALLISSKLVIYDNIDPISAVEIEKIE